MTEQNMNLICKLIKVLTLLYHRDKKQVIIKVLSTLLFRMQYKRGRRWFMVLSGVHEEVQ